MSHLMLTRRRFCGSVLALSPVARFAETALRSGSAPTTGVDLNASSLRVIRRPCSVRKVCQALSRQFRVTVAPDAWLQEQRVVWAFNGDVSLETVLGRLAELTDSRVVERRSDTGRRRFNLERKPETVRRERAWKTEALSRTVRELLRAADENEHGSLNTDSFTTNVRSYAGLGRAPQYKFLRLLTPEQEVRLLQGERIRLPIGVIPESEIQQLVLERYSGPSVADETQEEIQRYRDDELQRIRQFGLALQIDFNRTGSLFYLMLQIGDRGGNALCGFGNDELGLPLTRTKAYRLLATESKTAPLAAAPAALQRRLEEDVVLSGTDGSWGSALAALGLAIGADMVSDGYLCRFQSILHARPGEKLVLARRGVTAAEALDLICQRYGYL
jgi:hypothetical protein